MTNKTKIIIAILIIAAIAIGIIGIVNSRVNYNSGSKEEEQINEMLKYFNDSENSSVENNIVENKNEKNATTQNNQAQASSSVIGREEQESKNENTSVNNEQKALDMAKKEWGLSVDSYKFEAELQSDGTYQVTVRSKDSNLTEVARYMVNVQSGTIKEM